MADLVPYLNLDAWRLRTLMAPERVDALEAKRPGFIVQRLKGHTSKINARLWKRYQVPFANPIEIVLQWLADLVTADAYKATGFDPSSEQDQTILDDATKAEAEILEASNAEKGLFDLPLREGTDQSSAVVQGSAFGYAEASPYAWLDVQREALSDE